MTRFLPLLLFAALTVANADERAIRLAAEGGKLTDQQAAELEQTLVATPDNMEVRTKLLGYCFLRQRFDEAIRQKRTKNILWIIANHPESEIAGSPFVGMHLPLSTEEYEQARQLWALQVAKSKNNPAVLANAANFVFVQDKDLAEKYLKQLEQLEPTNAKWPERLAFLYRLQANSSRQRDPDASRQSSACALGKMEQVFQMTGSATNQTHLFIEAARDAFYAGNLSKARAYADKYSASNPNDHSANAASVHALLGQIDLQEDKVDSAKAHLLAVAKLEHWPQNALELGRGLLAKGEKDAVIEYLEICQSSERGEMKSAERWLHELRETGTTDFRERGRTPAEIQTELKSKMTPEQYAAFSNRIATSAHKIRPGGLITINSRWGVTVSGEGVLKWLDGLWRERNLAGLEAQMMGGGDGIPTLLAKAVYTSFLKNNRGESAAILKHAEELARQRSLKSFAMFQEAFRTAEQALPAGKAFETYPDEFPLRAEILKVGQELQANVDEQLKAWSRRENFECRNNEVFYINETDLNGKIAQATKGITGVITADKRAAQEQALAGMGTDFYLLDVSHYIKNHRSRLQPRADTHGTDATGLDQVDNLYLQTLARLDRRSRTIYLLVRPGNEDIAHKCQALAAAAGFEVTAESLANDQPITLGPTFDANGIALGTSPERY